MKKTIQITALLLALLLLGGCGEKAPEQETTLPPQTEQTQAPATLPTYAETENPVRYLSISMGPDYENVKRMDVFSNEDGTVHVEYVGEVKKVGDFDPSLWHGITDAIARSGLSACNGKDAYGDGEANASMYVEFSDDSILAVGYSGRIPQEFVAGCQVMDAFFGEVTAALPVYVPQPLVMGTVDAALLEEAMGILNGSGIEMLDAYTISEIAVDEYFAFTAGLTDDKGIAAAASCAPMMMTSAYSMVLVTLDGTVEAKAVCEDFIKNLDWFKWVCVTPDAAAVAVKDNMVLCLIAYEPAFTETLAGIEHMGWTVTESVKKP